MRESDDFRVSENQWFSMDAPPDIGSRFHCNGTHGGVIPLVFMHRLELRVSGPIHSLWSASMVSTDRRMLSGWERSHSPLIIILLTGSPRRLKKSALMAATTSVVLLTRAAMELVVSRAATRSADSLAPFAGVRRRLGAMFRFHSTTRSDHGPAGSSISMTVTPGMDVGIRFSLLWAWAAAAAKSSKRIVRRCMAVDSVRICVAVVIVIRNRM